MDSTYAEVNIEYKYWTECKKYHIYEVYLRRYPQGRYAKDAREAKNKWARFKLAHQCFYSLRQFTRGAREKWAKDKLFYTWFIVFVLYFLFFFAFVLYLIIHSI